MPPFVEQFLEQLRRQRLVIPEVCDNCLFILSQRRPTSTRLNLFKLFCFFLCFFLFFLLFFFVFVIIIIVIFIIVWALLRTLDNFLNQSVTRK